MSDIMNNKARDTDRPPFIVVALFLLFLATVFFGLFASCKNDKLIRDYDTCCDVGGTKEQCTKLVYPDRWEEEESQRNKMRNRLKKN